MKNKLIKIALSALFVFSALGLPVVFSQNSEFSPIVSVEAKRRTTRRSTSRRRATRKTTRRKVSRKRTIKRSTRRTSSRKSRKTVSRKATRTKKLTTNRGSNRIVYFTKQGKKYFYNPGAFYLNVSRKEPILSGTEKYAISIGKTLSKRPD